MNKHTPTLEDRKTLCRRPEKRSHIIFQSWQKLLFLHWKIDPAEVQKKLPVGLTVDAFDNCAYVGVVPFYMWNIRPRFLPAVPWISFFLEINVRTYVHDENGVPGVWFFSLDTNQALAACVGRRFFHMPYTNARMKAERNSDGLIQYECHRHSTPISEKTEFVYRGISNPESAEPGTLEFFLAERYLLYAENPRDGQLYSGRVFHEPYPLQKADVRECSNIPIKQAGLFEISENPVHAAYTDGVDVVAYPLEKLQTKL